MSKKSEGVKDVFKWLDKECKKQKKCLDLSKEEYEKDKKWCCFDDTLCILESDKEAIIREQAKLDALVFVKISTEKYWRKLKHEEEES